jgi:hypothetical protein
MQLIPYRFFAKRAAMMEDGDLVGALAYEKAHSKDGCRLEIFVLLRIYVKIQKITAL